MLINVNIINKITAAYKVTSQFMLENATKTMLERVTLGNNDALRQRAPDTTNRPSQIKIYAKLNLG